MVAELCRCLRRRRPAAMPDLYLGALKAAFGPHLQDPGAEGHLQAFSQLAQKIAGKRRSALLLVVLFVVTIISAG